MKLAVSLLILTPTGQKIIKVHFFTFGPHFRIIRFLSTFVSLVKKVQIFLFRPHKQRECEEGSTTQHRYYWNPIRYNSRIKLFQSNVFQRYKKKTMLKSSLSKCNICTLAKIHIFSDLVAFDEL